MKPETRNGDPVKPDRPIRSFVKREGRLTPGQQRNLEELWPRFGLDPEDGPFDWSVIFGRDAPRTLEIGFGAGEVLATLADACRDEDFIGIEVYRSGVGRLLGEAAQRDMSNVRAICADAVEIIDSCIPAASLDTVLLYFPDPWPKKRHHKRRLVQAAFADRIHRILKPGGVWRLATDWANYAEWMREVLDIHPGFENIGDYNGRVSRPPRPATRFEQRGLRRGHAVVDLAYRRR